MLRCRGVGDSNETYVGFYDAEAEYETVGRGPETFRLVKGSVVVGFVSFMACLEFELRFQNGKSVVSFVC